MPLRSPAIFLPSVCLMLLSFGGLPLPSTALPRAAEPRVKQEEGSCPAPALSRVVRHRVASGETIESIAQRYNLIPATLIGFNPALRSGNPAAGTELLIPPYNGIRVEAPAGASWRDLAQTYNIRADVLFEVNGCQEVPRTVFIPGVNWSPGGTATAASSANSPIRRYPLPENATVLMGYGWQLDPSQGEVVFNSGVQLEAASGTSVLAAGDGTVAFAGQQGNYGNLVVINHSQGLQTRYAQIDSVSVEVGQQVQAGTPIGTIAAGGEGASPRLQFEVRSNSDLGWVAQDPGNYLPGLRLSRQTNRQPQPNGQQ